MARELMLLFLDFDGVLRRKQAPLYRLEASLVERLAAVLREYPEVGIVVTSSWTDAYSLDHIKGLFPSDLALRILGKTPRVRGDVEHARYREVLAYLRRSGMATPWVALDDDPLHYPENAPVVLLDPETGLDAEGVLALKRHFETARTGTMT